MRFALPVLALGAACNGGNGDPAPTPTKIEMLDPVESLTRASMAVRGQRPSLDEIAQMEADPAALDGLVDGWMTSDAFAETIKDLHAELYLIRADTNFQLPVAGIVEQAGYSQGDLHRSTVEAPLELVKEIVLEDRPYTEILTTDYTVADDVVATIYGLTYDDDAGGWQHTQWSDGRPQSGLLSDSEMWRRHVSNAANYHRGRANFVSRTFLCEDIASRDVFVEGGVDISKPDAVAEAVSTNPGCIGCHNALDPLAAFWWGYKEQLHRGAILTAYASGCEWDWTNGPPPRDPPSYRIEHWCYPLKFYDVSDQDLWYDKGLKAPAYYGVPADDMTDLGWLVTEDPRFATCTARTFAGYLTQTDRMELPVDYVNEMREVFVESGYSAKALVKAIVLSEPFQTRRVLPASDIYDRAMDAPELAGFVPGLQTLRPEQASRTFADLTGFTWLANQDAVDCENIGSNSCWNNIDLVYTDLFGFRSMMGGIDGYTVTHPIHSPTPTHEIVLGKLAREAAGFVLQNEFDKPAAERRLLTLVEPTTVDEVSVRNQIAALHLRILSERLAPDSEEIGETYALWSGMYAATSDTAKAWEITISALLQDPRMVFY